MPCDAAFTSQTLTLAYNRYFNVLFVWCVLWQMIAATSVCGIIYAAFAGQPLTIIGSTGPVLAFIAVLYKTAARMVIYTCFILFIVELSYFFSVFVVFWLLISLFWCDFFFYDLGVYLDSCAFQFGCNFWDSYCVLKPPCFSLACRALCVFLPSWAFRALVSYVLLYVCLFCTGLRSLMCVLRLPRTARFYMFFASLWCCVYLSTRSCHSPLTTCLVLPPLACCPSVCLLLLPLSSSLLLLLLFWFQNLPFLPLYSWVGLWTSGLLGLCR